jgi:1,2-diacylglycerol 3-beta-galactosyltransferase
LNTSDATLLTSYDTLNNNTASYRRFTEITSNMRCHNSFGRAIAAAKPDMIISVHPLCQYVPLKVLNRMEGGTRVTPFVTVVTDLGGAHPTWFHPGVDKCFVPSEVLRRDALSKGLRPDQIKLHGLPTRPGFWQPVKTDKASLQVRL